MSGRDLTKEVGKTIMLSYLSPEQREGQEQDRPVPVIDPEMISSKLVVQREPKSAECEYFRFLKSRITRYFNEKESPDGGKVITITGATRGCGKTVCSLNLSLAFARSFGSEILLLDGDSRNHNCETYLGIAPDEYPSGLTDVLSLQARAGQVLINTGLSGLIYFPAGEFREDFADKLKGAEIDILLKNLRKHFKFIIIDAPPVFPMPETSVLASLSDAVLLVMGAGMDGKLQLDNAVELLHGTNLVGVILNKVQMAPGIRYGAYGYY